MELGIKCYNPNCTAPLGIFFWRSAPEGVLAEPFEPGANSFIVKCPFCNMDNAVWVKKVRLEKVGFGVPLAPE
ncbi:Uncharacterised protein [uncultured archaeon]|nr:Uncharacterised protein [uncultured archaeon]